MLIPDRKMEELIRYRISSQGDIGYRILCPIPDRGSVRYGMISRSPTNDIIRGYLSDIRHGGGQCSDGVGVGRGRRASHPIKATITNNHRGVSRAGKESSSRGMYSWTAVAAGARVPCLRYVDEAATSSSASGVGQRSGRERDRNARGAHVRLLRRAAATRP